MLKEFIAKRRARLILKEITKINSLWIKGSIVEELSHSGKSETTLVIKIENSWNIEKYSGKVLQVLVDHAIKYRLYFFGNCDKNLEIKMKVKN